MHGYPKFLLELFSNAFRISIIISAFFLRKKSDTLLMVPFLCLSVSRFCSQCELLVHFLTEGDHIFFFFGTIISYGI